MRIRDRWVRGIKTALAVVESVEGESGFCTLRFVNFGPDGQMNVSYVELSRQEAEDTRAALSDLLQSTTRIPATEGDDRHRTANRAQAQQNPGYRVRRG